MAFFMLEVWYLKLEVVVQIYYTSFRTNLSRIEDYANDFIAQLRMWF